MDTSTDRKSQDGSRRRTAGYSLVELLVVIMVLGIIVMVGSSAWISAQRRSNCRTAVQMFKSFILQARMLAVYRGIHHFIVYDPASNSVSIYEDSSAPLGEFDTADRRIALETLPSAARLTMPPAPSPLSNPLGGANLTAAWSLPLPETSGAWGTNLRGLRMTPSGQIQSVEAAPTVVIGGVIVLTDGIGQTASVAVRGQIGSVRCFQVLDTAWSEI